ncbi:cytochrome b561 and DOMON domain-containing protein At3g25290 [Lycium ferocissimum]|uniref:cytochrome b561 and DOMON domain-containing protein At3g25290 n=1 Tax=Lycium ferocissimum TaxID=112874 RepID=UPI002815F638|nr:cytochrome b561 and DOMON domain-containing protein At3g25290 [Lycium ferocissimum]
MASHLHLFLTSLLVLLFISPSTSLTCSSQTFSANTKFTNCTDLPFLKSFLHWTFDTTKHTLSIAFIASPASPDGWIAWGINPHAPTMLGTQSLIAFKNAKGSVIVKTYNLTSYKSITESKLLYNVLDSKAESSSAGVMRIFATLELPENTTTVNQVWQVGPAVKDGMPVMHKLEADNLKSKTTLDLATSEGNKNNNGTASTSNSSSGQSGKETGGSSRMLKSETSVFAFLFFLGVVLLQL